MGKAAETTWMRGGILMKKKIAIIGHFGGNETFLDGQTVKTKVLCAELEKTGKYNIYKVDTYYKKHNLIRLLWQTFRVLFFYNEIFVLLSREGMKTYFPLLYYFTKLRHIRIFHDVIGGNLDGYVKKYPKWQKYLNAFDVNWVETQRMKSKLKELGVLNAEVLPNFKNLQNISATEYSEPVFQFCTFSRVMKEKGIENAVQVVNRINEEYGRTTCKLDIYGAIDAGYADGFETLKKSFGDAIKYGGLVPFAESVSVLKNYYALLFPTFWDGEGFPGTILDAYASAIPVIASDWNYNNELVCHMKTGIIYPSDEFADLYEAIKWSIEHRDEINFMRKNCAEEYLQYKPESVMEVIEYRLK